MLNSTSMAQPRPTARNVTTGHARAGGIKHHMKPLCQPSVRVGQVDCGACGAVTTDRKVICRKWARGSGPGPGVVIGPGQGRCGLRGLGDGDAEAEGFDLPDVVFDLLV